MSAIEVLHKFQHEADKFAQSVKESMNRALDMLSADSKKQANNLAKITPDLAKTQLPSAVATDVEHAEAPSITPPRM